MPDDDVIADQIAYYRARASEYDEWWKREGSYDLGAEVKAKWLAEVQLVDEALEAFTPKGRVLELASGTGWWSERLARTASDLTCVDASPEAIEIARTRVPQARLIAADLFVWEPQERFDVVFFSFWLSHVPQSRFDWFWGFVRNALTADGRVFFIDNLRTPMLELEGSAAHRHDEQPDGVVERHLNDGSTFRAVKVHHNPDELAERLRALGWVADVKTTGDFFYYGHATPSRKSWM